MIIVKRDPGRGKRIVVGVAAAVAAVVATVIFPLVINPMLIERRADRELMQVPAFQQIAKWEPAIYKRMKANVVAAVGRRESSAQIQGRIRADVQKLATQYMKTASDEAVVEYLQVTLEEIRQVSSKDPDVAFAMLYEQKTDVDMTKYIDDATQKRDAAALTEIIHTGVAKEAGYQNDRRATQLLTQIVEGMRRDFGADGDLPFNGGRRALPEGDPNDDAMTRLIRAQAVMQQPIDKARSVEMMVEFYNRVLSLRADQSAQIMRLLLSKV